MNRKVMLGLALILLGAMFLFDQLDIIGFGTIARNAWPILIILLGLWFILRKKDGLSIESHSHGSADPAAPVTPPPPIRASYPAPPAAEPTAAFSSASAAIPDAPNPQASTSLEAAFASRLPHAPSVHEPGRLKFERTFGDMFIDCRDLELQSVAVSSFLGDTDLLLRGGRLSHGLNRLIISGFIGDIHIIVPPAYPVAARCSNSLGDIELFGRKTSGVGGAADMQSPEYAAATAKLYIVVKNFMGDIRIVQAS